MSRYDLTDFEWRVIAPLLPNKPRGVPRVDDRRVLNGIFWVLRSGAPWRDLPERYGPRTTCYNRFVRWRRVSEMSASQAQTLRPPILQSYGMVLFVASLNQYTPPRDRTHSLLDGGIETPSPGQGIIRR